MSLLLIDDQGKVWQGESRELRVAFDSPYSGGEFTEYAVKNLGFIAIDIYGSSAQLRLRPNFLGEKTLASVRQWLQSSKVQRVALTTFKGGWHNELVRSGDVDARLEQIGMANQNTRPADYLARPLPVEKLDMKSPMPDLVKGWAHLVNEYEAETLFRLLRTVFADQYVIVKRSDGQDKLQFQEFGERMFSRYDTWRTCAVGAPIEEQPDREYGRWVGASYRQALARKTPQLETVDAVFRCPEKGRFRRRYRRMIFPINSESTGQLLFGGSFDDPTVDLRVQAP